MRKYFLAERFLLFRSWNISSHLCFSQRWNASTKAAPSNDDGRLLDLLDQVGQDISIGTDPRGEKSRDAAKPYLDGSAQEARSSMPDLPLSPLMDPKLISARQRYRTPKPSPTSPASELEQKLSKSPFARALVTPVRHCRLTDAKLPSYFLLSFGVTKHPITGAHWHLPRLVVDPLLVSKEDQARADTSLEDESADEISEIESTVDVSPENTKAPEDISIIAKSTEIKNLDDLPPGGSLEKLPSDSLTINDTPPHELKTKVLSPVPETRRAQSSYFICSQPALELLSNFKPKSWMHTIPPAWKTDSWIRTDKLVWRKDMDGFVLELLRKKVLALLKLIALSLIARSSGGYITSCSGYESVIAHHQVAAVLWLGPSAPANNPRCREPVLYLEPSISQQEVACDPLPPGTAALPEETTSTGHNFTPEGEVAAFEGPEPPFYAMVKYKSHFIPIYNLPKLLGSEHLAHLRATVPCAHDIMAVIKKKVRTVGLQMELWKLMGYMAQTETLGALVKKLHSGNMKGRRKWESNQGESEGGKNRKGEFGKEKTGKEEGENVEERERDG